MPTTSEALALQAQLEAELAAVTDAQTRLLVAAWAVAWSEISADLTTTMVDLLTDAPVTAAGRVSRATLFRSVRLRGALEHVAARLDRLAYDAGITITSDLASMVERAARAQDAIVAVQLPDLADPGTLPLSQQGPVPTRQSIVRQVWQPAELDALDAIVRRSTEQITSRLRPVPAETADVVRRELIRGVAVGDNPRNTARRMVQRAGHGFNGGLSRALTIARTEMLDAHRAGAGAGQARHPQVLAGWVWLAHLDEKTCPACLRMHGELFSLTEAGPQGHPNCRCARMPKTKSWADLGFEGLDEPGDAVVDARAWFEALTPAQQLRIMGPGRLAMLQSGEAEWVDLAYLRSSQTWRDSWQVTPLHVLRSQNSGGRAARAS